jgi:hypothetical protein
MTDHTANEILYAKQHLAWLEAGKPEGKEPWRDWQSNWSGDQWDRLECGPPSFIPGCKFRYNPFPRTYKVPMEDGTVLEYPEPLREMPELESGFWTIAYGGEVTLGLWYGSKSKHDYQAFLDGSLYATEADAIKRRDNDRILHGAKA